MEALGVPIENFARSFGPGLPGGGFRLIAFISSYFMAFSLGELFSGEFSGSFSPESCHGWPYDSANLSRISSSTETPFNFWESLYFRTASALRLSL
jgi:hypothetical protein